MVKKSAVLLTILIITLFLASIIYVELINAQTQTTEQQKVAKAFDWLTKQVKGKWVSLNIKQHVFSVLALSCNETYFKAGNSSLYAKRFSNQNISCWGASNKPTSPDGCLLTETALAKVALDSWRDNTTKVTRWLLSRNMTQVTNINWFLQVDVDRGSNASCEIIYGGNEENIFSVGADKKVSINASSKCFYIEDVVNEPYWFKIKQTPECYSYTYTIKCWSNATVYRASLLYRKPGSGIWHVSSETQSGRPGVPGSNRIEDQPNPLELKITSYCLSSPINIGNCDYEGTAWAAYALATSGNSDEKLQANLFVPYLVVFAEDNIQFFPASFLYPVTSQARYNDEILRSQKVVGTDKGYWLIQPIIYGRVYDTAHAGLSLGASGGESITKAKNYLLANQETNGNLVSVGYGESQKESIRDTAFALWVFWRGQCPGGIIPGGACTDMGADYICENLSCDPTTEIEIPDLVCEEDQVCCKFIGMGGEEECTTSGGACRDICNETEFEIETIFCPDFKYCCKTYESATCEEMQGAICDPLIGETCLGDEVQSLNGSCCLGTCSGGVSEENCLDVGEPCDSGYVCINQLTWSVIPFTTTQDTDRCCVGTSVKCVEDKSCSSVGEKCSLGEECVGNIVETKDEEQCCEGECLPSCAKQGGTICTTEQKCSGTMTYSSEYPEQLRCCTNGECKKPAGLWWVWLIIIIVILGGGAAYYFLVYAKKQKKLPKEKPSIFPGLGPITRPIVRPSPQPAFRPLPSGPRPQPQLRPLTSRPMPMPKPGLRPAPSVPATAIKPKGKTESELEKTLSKLKKMSKK